MGKRKNPDLQIKFIRKNDGKPDSFARVYRSLFEDERFKKLSPMARLIYIHMVMHSGVNPSKFTYARGMYSKICSPDTFARAKRELKDNGFIEEVARYRSSPNIYELSAKWQR